MKQSGGFAVIPVEVLKIGNGYAIAVYAAIAQHANREGYAWPSLDRLAEMTGWSRPTVVKAVKMLESSGAISKERRQVSGFKQSNRYHLTHHNHANVQMETSFTKDGNETRKPTNVQMETSLPSLETSLTQDGNDVDVGWKPRLQEQYPVEQEPNEQDTDSESGEFDQTLRVVPGGKDDDRKPMPRHGMAQTLLATLHEDVLNIGPPTNYKRAVGVAGRLANAGCTPLELKQIAEWLLNDPFWGPKGVTIQKILDRRDDWHAAKAAEAKKPKQADAKSGLVFG